MKRSERSGRNALALAGLLLGAVLLLSGCVEALLVGGATGGALVANDRRPPEVVLGDERVELAAQNRLGERFGDKVHTNVTSFNYSVLLTGEVPDVKTREEAEKLVAGVDRVKGVVNELQVAGMTSLASRGNDSYLTGRVKAAFVAARKFSATHVKVVTENGVVYLLGLVTRREADDATEIARGIAGVQKVVRVFEYLPAAPASASTK